MMMPQFLFKSTTECGDIPFPGPRGSARGLMTVLARANKWEREVSPSLAVSMLVMMVMAW